MKITWKVQPASDIIITMPKSFTERIGGLRQKSKLSNMCLDNSLLPPPYKFQIDKCLSTKKKFHTSKFTKRIISKF